MRKLRLLYVFIAALMMTVMAIASNPTVEADVAVDEAVRSYLVSQTDIDMDYRTLNVLEDELGQIHVRMQAVLNGYPVYGHQVLAHLWAGTREVISIDGVLVDQDGPYTSKVTADPMVGLSAALDAMNVKEFEIGQDPQLAYVVDQDLKPVFSYMSEVRYEDENGPQVDLVFTSVKTGELVARHPQNHYAKNRQTYTCNNGTSLPGTLVRSETTGTSSDTCLNNAHNYAGTTYDYYKNVHNRDSLNNAGLTIKSSVHYSRSYNNAFWNNSQMVYGDGDGTTFSCLSGDLDVVAHELSHGVCSYSANLTYSNESGALNEGNSDIFAAAVESYAGASSADVWKIGENIYTPTGSSTDALRYMNNPTQDGSSRDYYPERYTGTSDNGGVHWNSGIANLFYYLLVQGGTHPRGKTTVSVTGIGMSDAQRIWYRALTVYMSSSTNFSGARTACLNAATDLFGSTSAQYTSVCNAWAAVGVGTCGGGGGSCTPGGGTVSGISSSTGTWKYYTQAVPACATSLTVGISGGTGDADLYVRLGSNPTTSTYLCRPYLSGNNETCNITPTAGTYYIGIRAYSTFSGVTLTVSYN